jgi:hypothetical protein
MFSPCCDNSTYKNKTTDRLPSLGILYIPIVKHNVTILIVGKRPLILGDSAGAIRGRTYAGAGKKQFIHVYKIQSIKIALHEIQSRLLYNKSKIGASDPRRPPPRKISSVDLLNGKEVTA